MDLFWISTQKYIDKMNTKFLYCNGDSFAFGQELDGPRPAKDIYTFSDFQRHNCYSGVIADRLGLEYKNESLPGGSNQRMYRTTLKTVTELLNRFKPDEIFVMLSATHCNRREFYFSSYKSYIPHMATYRPPVSAEPILKLWDLISNYFSSDIDDHDLDQMMLLGVQNFLRINRVPYIITSSMNHKIIYEDEKKFVSESVLNQRYKLRHYDYPSFAYHVFHQLRLPRAPEGHPYADGHLAWADHLMKYIEENNLFNNSDL